MAAVLDRQPAIQAYPTRGHRPIGAIRLCEIQAWVKTHGVAEVLALAAAVPNRYKATIVFAAGMGSAQASASASRRRGLDFLRRTVRVDGFA